MANNTSLKNSTDPKQGSGTNKMPLSRVDPEKWKALKRDLGLPDFSPKRWERKGEINEPLMKEARKMLDAILAMPIVADWSFVEYTPTAYYQIALFCTLAKALSQDELAQKLYKSFIKEDDLMEYESKYPVVASLFALCYAVMAGGKPGMDALARNHPDTQYTRDGVILWIQGKGTEAKEFYRLCKIQDAVGNSNEPGRIGMMGILACLAEDWDIVNATKDYIVNGIRARADGLCSDNLAENISAGLFLTVLAGMDPKDWVKK